MGFRLNRVYVLQFGGDLAGLEVSVRSTSVGAINSIKDKDAGELAAMLAEYVIDWNYEDADGKPLPVSAESFLSLEEAVMAAIIKEWYRAAKGISAPLDDGSTSGETASPESSFPESEIPMTSP